MMSRQKLNKRVRDVRTDKILKKARGCSQGSLRVKKWRHLRLNSIKLRGNRKGPRGDLSARREAVHPVHHRSVRLKDKKSDIYSVLIVINVSFILIFCVIACLIGVLGFWGDRKSVV